MEMGGNAKVNAIFEANLSQSGRTKPTHLADGQTRERFIRDKYERRKYYDPAGFSVDYSSSFPHAAPSDLCAVGGGEQRPGAPSEIARQRVASRQSRMKPTHSNMYESQPTRSAPTKVAQAPVSAPMVLDLLDFSADNTPAQSSPPSANSDPFLAAPASHPPFPPVPQATPGSNSSPQQATSQSRVPAQGFNNPTLAPGIRTSNESILALFGPPQQQEPQSGYGMQAISEMVPRGMNNNNHNAMIMGVQPISSQHAQCLNASGGGLMITNNQTNGNAGFTSYNLAGNTHVMQLQHVMPNMTMGGNQMNLHPPMQQMMIAQQQNQHRYQSQMGMNINNAMSINPGNIPSSNFSNTMRGMQVMEFGQISGINRQQSEDGGFETPMGGSAHQNTAYDPFNSLGGMNSFR
jgi:hypothetical protein